MLREAKESIKRIIPLFKSSIPKPLRDEVVIKQQSRENKTEAGIILTTDVAIKENVGEVVAMGSKAEELKIGDKVLFGPGFVVQEIDKEEYLIMRQQNILLVLDNE